MSEPRILYFDLETLPAVAVTFNLFKPIFSPDHILEHPRIAGFSYMWQGWKRARWSSEFHHPEGRIGMLTLLRDLVNEADVLVGYNSQSFDHKWVRGELMVEGISPPAPVQHIDLYRQLKQNSRFISGKLDYAAQRLLNDRKIDTGGITLWVDCIKGKRRAWDEMRKYALKDTELLPPLYEKIRPFIETRHPNMALMKGKPQGCPTCASENTQRRGFRYTRAGKYQQYSCLDCGAWFRGTHRIETTEGR